MNSDELVPTRPTGLIRGNSPEAEALLQEKVEGAERTIRKNRKAKRTMQAYAKHVLHWSRWAAQQGLHPFPATTAMVLAYLHDQEPALAKVRGEPGRLSIATVKARLAAVAFSQRQLQDPIGAPPVTRSAEVLGLLKALQLEYRDVQGIQDQKRPMVDDLLWKIIPTLSDTLVGCRDRAILLLGMRGAMRRSEISALQFEDILIEDSHEGPRLKLLIRKSKTDQKGAGQDLGIIPSDDALCPAAAFLQWCKVSQIESGPLFWRVTSNGKRLDRQYGPLTGHSIARIVKQHIERVGLDASGFSGHSLRAGFATESSERGSTLIEIALHTRHKNLETLKRYVRLGTLFSRGNPTRKMGRRDG